MPAQAALDPTPAASEDRAISHPIAAQPPRRVFVILSFFSIYVIWGSTYLVIRFAIETIPPLYTAGFRHLIAGSILLAWCFAKRLRPTRAQIRASFMIGVLFFLIGHGSLHWAELRVPSGLASLLVAIEPIIVFLMASFAARKWRFNAKLLSGVLLGLAGVGLLTARTAVSSGRGTFIATMAILIGAISWSAGIVYSRRSNLSGHPLLLSALSLLWGAVLLITTGTMVGEARGFSIHNVTVRSWLALGYLIIFGSVIAFSAYNWLLEHYSPTLVATHTFVNPIVAVVLGWLFGGEALTFNVLLAAAMVIGAVVLVDRGTAQLDAADKPQPSK
ncbi:MAG TPA: EamA family transporter [Candidatus Eremiobacteraceae bacterium]|nr:EamA family transporter [Candidatus Eremiobacteraceae bacterium]